MSDVTSDCHCRTSFLVRWSLCRSCFLFVPTHHPQKERESLGEFEMGCVPIGSQRVSAQRALARSALALSAPQVHFWIRGSDLRIAHPQDPRPYSMSLTQTLTRANHYELQSKEATVNHSIT